LHLKKPHPCGSNAWLVTRLGADIGLRCQGCSHYIMLPRAELERRVKNPSKIALPKDNNPATQSM
jgi:hypothetical protein